MAPSAEHVSVDNFMNSPRYDEIVELVRASAAAESGVDVFRLEDPLNDVSNLREAGEAIVAAELAEAPVTPAEDALTLDDGTGPQTMAERVEEDDDGDDA